MSEEVLWFKNMKGREAKTDICPPFLQLSTAKYSWKLYIKQTLEHPDRGDKQAACLGNSGAKDWNDTSFLGFYFASYGPHLQLKKLAIQKHQCGQDKQNKTKNQASTKVCLP